MSKMIDKVVKFTIQAESIEGAEKKLKEKRELRRL